MGQGMAKLKTEVRINDDPGENDIDLELTSDQSVLLLDLLVAGAVLHLNLQTPGSSTPARKIKEAPDEYAA
jgi:hypothetical protein